MPRVLEIVYEINSRFVAEVAKKYPKDISRQQRMAIVENGPDPMVRMAHLAIVGSYSVNGVAALHSELLKQGLFHDFHELYPKLLNNKTNGVTQRRWLKSCNPGLSDLISEKIGDDWVTNLDELSKLVPLAKDSAFQKDWQTVKTNNKQKIADLVLRSCGIELDPNALFDISGQTHTRI